MKPVFLGGVLVVALAQAGFAVLPAEVGLWPLAALLLLFFAGFNLLEALLPSLVSRLAPATSRGLALGIYSTSQSLGIFAGGALGGFLLKHLGEKGIFITAVLLLMLWFWLARSTRRWPGSPTSSA